MKIKRFENLKVLLKRLLFNYKYLLLILFIIFNKVIIAQNISKTIDSMIVEDQKWRGFLRQLENEQFDSLPKEIILQNIKLTDSLNYNNLKSIFSKFGFPNYKLVGKQTSHNFWLLVQHSDNYPKFQKNVLKGMKVEVKNKNANAQDYAYLLDRVKINNGKKQVFGTQMILNSDSSSYVPKPVLSILYLNKRRKEMGLPSIEEYIKLMNERYFGTLKTAN